MSYVKKQSTIIAKRVLCLSLAVTIFLSLFMLTPQSVSASSTKEDLITGLNNSANGEFSFYINVPAKTTANYSIKLIPNKKNKSIDTVSGSVKNSENKTKKIKVKKSVHYYSSAYSYTVTANYNYKKKNYTDTDSVKSFIPTKTFYSTKFVWTEANIKAYKANKRVEVVTTFAVGIAIDVFVTKGYVTTALATTYSVGGVASILIGIDMDSDIRNTAIKGWGYKLKAVPNEKRDAYTLYLLTYNSKGTLADTEKIGKAKMSPYCSVIK